MTWMTPVAAEDVGGRDLGAIIDQHTLVNGLNGEVSALEVGIVVLLTASRLP